MCWALILKAQRRKISPGKWVSPAKYSEIPMAQNDDSLGSNGTEAIGSPVRNVASTATFIPYKCTIDKFQSVPGINFLAKGIGSVVQSQSTPRFGQGELSNLKYSPGGITLKSPDRSILPKVQHAKIQVWRRLQV